MNDEYSPTNQISSSKPVGTKAGRTANGKFIKIKVRRSHATAKNKNPRTSSKQSRYEYLECSTTRSSVNSIFLLEFEEISGVHLNRANSLEVYKKIFKKGFFITVSLMTCKIERKFSPSSFLMSHSLHVVFSINLFFLFFLLFLC